MAEDEVTPEQLAAIAAENEEPEPVNYKPPAQKSVKEIQDLDKDDESLCKYKETLLGPGVTSVGNVMEWGKRHISIVNWPLGYRGAEPGVALGALHTHTSEAGGVGLYHKPI